MNEILKKSSIAKKFVKVTKLLSRINTVLLKNHLVLFSGDVPQNCFFEGFEKCPEKHV